MQRPGAGNFSNRQAVDRVKDGEIIHNINWVGKHLLGGKNVRVQNSVEDLDLIRGRDCGELHFSG